MKGGGGVLRGPYNRLLCPVCPPHRPRRPGTDPLTNFLHVAAQGFTRDRRAEPRPCVSVWVRGLLSLLFLPCAIKQ